MFNLGLSELIVIGIIALIFIGPKQLPEVARVVGRLLNELKRAAGDITGSYVQVRNDADEALRRTKRRIMENANTPVQPKPSSEKVPLNKDAPAEEPNKETSAEEPVAVAKPAEGEDQKS